MAKLCFDDQREIVSMPFVISSEEGEPKEKADTKGRGIVSLLLAEGFDILVSKRRTFGTYRFVASCTSEKIPLFMQKVKDWAKAKDLAVEF